MRILNYFAYIKKLRMFFRQKVEEILENNCLYWTYLHISELCFYWSATHDLQFCIFKTNKLAFARNAQYLHRINKPAILLEQQNFIWLKMVSNIESSQNKCMGRYRWLLFMNSYWDRICHSPTQPQLGLGLIEFEFTVAANSFCPY